MVCSVGDINLRLALTTLRDPAVLAVARMKITDRERIVMSPSESKVGNALALISPCVNMAGDVFVRK